MSNPQRGRKIGLMFFASGVLLGIIHSQLPQELVQDRLLGAVLIFYWPNAILFGGGHALIDHFKVRAQKALARGDDIIARWHIDSATWRAFIAHNATLNQESGAVVNELSIREDVPAQGVEVVVGKTAVDIGGSVHMLPRRGTPEITHAELNISRVRPSFIELHLYYPEGGTGDSGVPHSSMRTALRFPVPPHAHRDAESVVAHYRGDQPGKADFFHGAGDGTNSEDVSTCYKCGYATHKYISQCPQCGASMQSKRWSRRFGWMLFACGLFITCLIGWVIFYTLQLMLRPGASVSGMRFGGTAGQAVFALSVFGTVLTFGVTTMLHGLWQVRTGRRSKRVIYSIIGLAGVLIFIGLIVAIVGL